MIHSAAIDSVPFFLSCSENYIVFASHHLASIYLSKCISCYFSINSFHSFQLYSSLLHIYVYTHIYIIYIIHICVLNDPMFHLILLCFPHRHLTKILPTLQGPAQILASQRIPWSLQPGQSVPLIPSQCIGRVCTLSLWRVTLAILSWQCLFTRAHGRFFLH